LSAAAFARLEALEDVSDILVTCWLAAQSGDRRQDTARLSASVSGNAEVKV